MTPWIPMTKNAASSKAHHHIRLTELGEMCRNLGCSKENEETSHVPRKKKTSWQFFVTFLGWLSDPFQWLSDLQLGDEKVTAWITWLLLSMKYWLLNDGILISWLTWNNIKCGKQQATKSHSIRFPSMSIKFAKGYISWKLLLRSAVQLLYRFKRVWSCVTGTSGFSHVPEKSGKLTLWFEQFLSHFQPLRGRATRSSSVVFRKPPTKITVALSFRSRMRLTRQTFVVMGRTPNFARFDLYV